MSCRSRGGAAIGSRFHESLAVPCKEAHLNTTLEATAQENERSLPAIAVLPEIQSNFRYSDSDHPQSDSAFPATQINSKPGLKGLLKLVVVILLTVTFSCASSWMTKSISAMKQRPHMAKVDVAPNLANVATASEFKESTEQEILAEMEQLRKSVSEKGVAERELADRFQLSADCLQNSMAASSTNWSGQVRRQVQDTVVEFYSKAAHIYKALEFVSNEMGIYEKLEMRLVAPDNLMNRHLKLLADNRVSSEQVANSAIPLGLNFIEHGNYSSAEQAWLQGLDRAAGKEIAAGLRLSRLVSDLYDADKKYSAEEPCRKLAVRLGLQQCNSPADEQAIRNDATKWQKCLAAIGKKARADKLSKYIASPDIRDIWKAIDGSAS